MTASSSVALPRAQPSLEINPGLSRMLSKLLLGGRLYIQMLFGNTFTLREVGSPAKVNRKEWAWLVVWCNVG